MLRRVLTALLIAATPVAVKAGPALVIDAKSGLVLYSEDADRLWHPASLTKLMTAYLAFEALRDGKLTIQSELKVSENAHKEPPSKIGLPIGATMSMDLALKALVIKSANDVAVMVAEGVAGSVPAFIDRMNQTAARLGMTRTKFFNPHGLPHEGQVTTARDMAILGRRILKEFPEWSYLFSMRSFKIGGRALGTHNGLLKTFEGADGMKTGFICDSGFNVVASATRNDVKVMAVVFGELSGRERTARAAELIEHGFDFYGWKEMFSASLDQVAVEEIPDNRPGDMSMAICKR
jgi:D-alanyl-D-alanine carboxypeptidase